MALGIISALLPTIGSVLDRVIPDKSAASKAKAELTAALMAQEGEIQKPAAEIVKEEAKSEHWLTATWRPILMLGITAGILNNMLFAPYISAIFGTEIIIDIPEQMWFLLNLGVGGYVMGRSGEKMWKTWKGQS